MKEPTFRIEEIEDTLLCVFCAEPTAADMFDAEPEDIADPFVRKVVETALAIRRKEGIPVTVEVLASAGCGELAVLRSHGRRVTAQMREDWPIALDLVRRASRKRALLASVVTLQRDLTRAGLFDLDDVMGKGLEDLTRLAINRTTNQPHDISDILDRAESGVVTSISDPMPTGVGPIDKAMKGGIRISQILVMVAPEKGGKTTTLRNLFINLAFSLTPILHVAGDGGDRTKHAITYLAMRAAYHCLSNGIPTTADGFEYDMLDPFNVAAWLNNRNPQNQPRALITPMSDLVEDAIHTARSELRDLREKNVLKLTDPKEIGFSHESLVRFIKSSHYQYGSCVIGIDHIGKFGDIERYPEIYTRARVLSSALIQLSNSLPLSLIILSQMSAEGIRDVTNGKDDDQSYNAGIEGGRMWQQEADLIVQLKRNGDTVSIRRKLNRDGGGHGPWDDVKVHLGSGLILPSYVPVEGY